MARNNFNVPTPAGYERVTFPGGMSGTFVPSLRKPPQAGPMSPSGSLPSFNQAGPTAMRDFGSPGVEAQRVLSAQQDADRFNAASAGYDQQILNSRSRGDQGYQQLSNNYDAVTADASATRDRNMARVDLYGNSMRDDLNRQNTQRLAASSQSAIMRGLGNTTIHDSLQRGTNFDNTRQLLSLEDQLLQNRISTDASLSAAYQNTLQNRATGLASQWNQNTTNENDLAGRRLSFLQQGVQSSGPSSMDVSNVYAQEKQLGFQREDLTQRGELQRDQLVFQREELAQQGALQREQLAFQQRQAELNYSASVPARFRLINGQVQKSTNNGASWAVDTDRPSRGSHDLVYRR